MAQNSINAMLRAWDNHTVERHPRVTRKVAVFRDDIARLEALAEVYELPVEDIISNLISNALREVEEKIPYVPGPRIIRTEEGDPVYEDAGHMPAYLQAKERLERKAG